MNLATVGSGTLDPDLTSNLDSLALTVSGTEACVGVAGGSPVTYHACEETMVPSAASGIVMNTPPSTTDRRPLGRGDLSGGRYHGYGARRLDRGRSGAPTAGT